ncbi:MAG: AAA family ATPase [Actinomycetota bacterium]
MTRIAPASAARPQASVVTTHISHLFFVGDRAYKLKRPVRFAFLDFSTREQREAACRREVELNRRLAPDVYLGVVDLIGPDGAPCDHLVAMRRMPAPRRLSTLISRRADVDGCLRSIARTITAFHERAVTSEEITRAGTPDAVRKNWDDNFSEMAPYVGSLLPADGFERVRALAHRYLDARGRLFRLRASEGRVRDGHGDLLADDIFCLDDGPRILDCIEFNDRFRYADVVADIAFLAMDIERLERPELADRLVAWYREFSGDPFPSSLADHYIAYRALVRSKVACIRAEQGERPARAEAARLLRLAHERLTRARPVIVLVGGLPGTGKSTLALGIADARRWALIRSDEVRKDLAGIAHSERAPAEYAAGIYTREMTERTYREMLARARRAIALGDSVVLDASWTDRHLREAAAAAAAGAYADLVELRCAAPHALAADRLRARNREGGDASDATPETARAMLMRADPWPDARTIDTTRPPEEALEEGLRALDAPPPPPDALEALAALVAE